MYSNGYQKPIQAIRRAISLPFVALALFGVCSFSSVFASLSIDEIPYGVSYPSGTFNVDDEITFSPWAGTQAEYLEDIVGVDLTFTLTSLAVFPTSLTPDFSNSWIADGDSMSVTVELDPDLKTIRILADRLSGSRNGHGELFSFTLISAAGQVTADELLSGSGGGVIVTIDDLVLRQASPDPKEAVGLTLYPNPTVGRLIAESDTDEVISMTLFNQAGRQVGFVRGSRFYFPESALPAGRYWVKLEMGSGMVERRQVVVGR